MIRLDKYLSNMQVGSRQDVKKRIRSGQVTVNERVVSSPEQKVDEETDRIAVNGRPVAFAGQEYYMLHKPAGVITATEDPRQPTVLDLITDRKRSDLFPVGRLDKDTEGLLLITNDGPLCHRLLSPKHHVEKVYYARIAGFADEQDIQAMKQGINIGSSEEPEMTMPAHLEILKADTVSEVRLTICEGKFHQVKRMFAARGKEVLYLKRIRMGSLALDETLEPGAYRALTEEEVNSL